MNTNEPDSETKKEKIKKNEQGSDTTLESPDKESNFPKVNDDN